jgi:hypothetical protein
MPPGVMIVSTSTPYQERRRCCTFIETWGRDLHFAVG